jgi:hypothetical protein
MGRISNGSGSSSSGSGQLAWAWAWRHTASHNCCCRGVNEYLGDSQSCSIWDGESTWVSDIGYGRDHTWVRAKNIIICCHGATCF